jgi:antitoxin HigA-1
VVGNWRITFVFADGDVLDVDLEDYDLGVDAMPMRNPPHPGGIVKDCIDDIGLSVTDAAKVLNVTRPTLSGVIKGRSAISPEMAIRLSLTFGSTPEMWLWMQTAYDLAQARCHADTLNVKRDEPSMQLPEPAGIWRSAWSGVRTVRSMLTWGITKRP